MKKAVLLPLLFVTSMVTHAAIRVVHVTNFQFSPANMTDVFVGDVIRYSFEQGFHDATSNGVASSIPAGAAAINSGNPSSTVRTYDYTVTQPGLYKYVCTVHADPAAFTGMIGQFTASVVTPVKLSFFSVGGANENAALTWKTQNEQNVDYFSIRRSLNGSTYSEIAKVPATGNSTTEKSYSFTDSKMSSDNKYYYYSLAVVDKDGKQTFSETKLYKNLKAATKLILTLSPNPISGPGHLMMTFNAEKEGKMEVRLVNPAGQGVISSTMQAFPGVNNGHLHLGSLATGTYTLICILDGVKESHQIVVK